MRHQRSNQATMAWGVILIGIGSCFLLMMNGVLPSGSLRTWWPLIVVVLGLGSLAGARDPHGVGSAVTTIGLGGWLLVAANDWYDLGWSRSWPLVFVAIGFGAVAEAALALVWKQEDRHVS